MKAVVLAAGFGRRMRPLTNTCHKTLIPVGDKTIIERIINGLYANKVKDIVIITGYLDNELKDFLHQTYQKTDIKFTYVHNEHYETTNNIHSLALGFNSIEIDDDIILIESDLIYEDDVIAKIINSHYPNVALVDKFRSGMDGTVVTVKNEIVSNIIPPHLQGSDFDFSDKFKTLNIYKFSQDFCNRVFVKLLDYYSKTIDNNCYYELILGILIYMQRETIHAISVENLKWTEVDDPNDLRIAEFIFNEKNKLQILENSFGGYWNYNVVDFCFIRNMYFPNYSMLADIKSNLVNLLTNYGSSQKILNEKLAYFLLCKKQNIQLLNGAAQVFPFLGTKFKDAKALIPTPTFGEYNRLFPQASTYNDNVGIDFTEVETKAKDAEIVVFVNPNNPTGSVIQTELIYNFSQKNPNKIIIVDESFIDFAPTSSIVDHLEKKPLHNIIVLKSLSKTLGVPGIRLGYMYSSNQELQTEVAQSIPVWNSNSIAEYFLEIILKHRDSLSKSYKQTIIDRDQFIKNLKTCSVFKNVYASGANFILAELKDTLNSQKFTSELLGRYSIYIKDVSSKFKNKNGMIRLAVRLPVENDNLIKAMNSLD